MEINLLQHIKQSFDLLGRPSNSNSNLQLIKTKNGTLTKQIKLK
jgi:hypothetical protein